MSVTPVMGASITGQAISIGPILIGLSCIF
jgi:hypothetical protein